MYKSFAVSLIVGLSASLGTAIGSFEPITVTVDDDATVLYAMSDRSRTGLAIDDFYSRLTLTGNPNGRSYFVTDMTDDGNDYFFKPQLLGGSVEFDIDLRGVECGCSTSLELLGMPGLDENGDIRIGNNGIPNCDARGNNKAKCPQAKLHVANTNGFRA